MDAGHASAVIEMGANHPGEIAYLTKLVVPTVGLVTNAGPSHLEGFGSVEGVAHAKGELFEHLPDDACAVVNLNDDWAGLWQELAADRRVVGYGVDIDAEFSVSSSSVEERPGGGQAFSVDAPGGARRIELPVAGRHNLRNALAAIAVAITAGANGADAATALARFNGIGGRMTPRRARNGAALIDDSYNANPASLKAAVDVLARLPGRRWLVLGDMGELGDDGAALHRDAGEYARVSGVERLFALGTLSREAADAFGAGAEHFDDVSALSERVAEDLSRDVTVLVKGSRGMKMERIVSALGEGE
jgi:UDP-N-acetylmuramoyl-tripeptide--D-alanyl-D-alanine ligase